MQRKLCPNIRSLKAVWRLDPTYSPTLAHIVPLERVQLQRIIYSSSEPDRIFVELKTLISMKQFTFSKKTLNLVSSAAEPCR